MNPWLAVFATVLALYARLEPEPLRWFIVLGALGFIIMAVVGCAL